MASQSAKLEHPIVAALYDAYMWPQERMGFRRQRQRMAGEAIGRVLEVAAGTGLTFPFYTRAQEVIATDADPAMLKRARRRAADASCPIRLLQADAESLPFADAEFDTILIAFGLCTIPHPENAVREARRVLKPGGQLLFLEHVRSTGRRHARLQDLVAPAWRRLTGGCNPNRSSLETIEREFDIDRLWRKGIIVQGSASAPGSAPPRPGSEEHSDAAHTPHTATISLSAPEQPRASDGTARGAKRSAWR